MNPQGAETASTPTRISEVEVVHLRLDAIKMEANGTQDAALIRVRTDAGHSGIGEVDSSPHVVAAIVDAPRSHSVAVGLREVLIGENPLDISRLWEKMYAATVYFGRRGSVIHAISGVDMALWDLAGKILGVPVYQLLGGSFRNRIPAYASALFGETPAETGRKAERIASEGFKAVKFGWGNFGVDASRDVEQVRTLRHVLGDDFVIMVDAGCCWDRHQSKEMVRRLEPFGLFWLEEPLPADDLDGYADLTATSPIRIAAGEQMSTRHDFRDAVDNRRAHILQPDISRVGGITEARRVTSYAEMHGVPCVPHNWSTGILTAASLHMNAAHANSLFLELSVDGSAINRDLVVPRFAIESDGSVCVPQGTGLGVDVDEGVINSFRVA